MSKKRIEKPKLESVAPRITNHNKFVKQENEWCFLPNKEKIKYHSLILLEVFYLEEFQSLIQGLDKLYENINRIDFSRLRYREILEQSRNKLFVTHTLNLPYVSNERLRGNVLPGRVFHKLGENINHLDIQLHQVFPSLAVLQIQVYFDDSVQDKINNIIYQYHEEKKETVETVQGSYETIKSPIHLKEKEISEIRQNLKNEVIKFLSNYFKGEFLKLHTMDAHIVPSIDLVSLNYPENTSDLIEWRQKHQSFFQCVGADVFEYYLFKYENYLFCSELNFKSTFNNYMIFANRKESADITYPDEDTSIEHRISFCAFDLLAMDRLVDIQVKMAGEFNTLISQELMLLNKNRIGTVIDTRRRISQNIFHFERFKTEFEQYVPVPDKFPFKGLKGKDNYLFDNVKKNLTKKMNHLEKVINTFEKHSNANLNLKNIEYSKKIQNLMIALTFLMIILAIIQIVVALNATDFITKI